MPKNRIRVLRLIARMNVGGPAIQITGFSDETYHNIKQLLILVIDRWLKFAS